MCIKIGQSIVEKDLFDNNQESGPVCNYEILVNSFVKYFLLLIFKICVKYCSNKEDKSFHISFLSKKEIKRKSNS